MEKYIEGEVSCFSMCWFLNVVDVILKKLKL